MGLLHILRLTRAPLPQEWIEPEQRRLVVGKVRGDPLMRALVLVMTNEENCSTLCKRHLLVRGCAQRAEAVASSAEPRSSRARQHVSLTACTAQFLTRFWGYRSDVWCGHACLRCRLSTSGVRACEGLT